VAFFWDWLFAILNPAIAGEALRGVSAMTLIQKQRSRLASAEPILLYCVACFSANRRKA
jgi:hypothetical protein